MAFRQEKQRRSQIRSSARPRRRREKLIVCREIMEE
jgi:hypothetical protein